MTWRSSVAAPVLTVPTGGGQDPAGGHVARAVAGGPQQDVVAGGDEAACQFVDDPLGAAVAGAAAPGTHGGAMMAIRIRTRRSAGRRRADRFQVADVHPVPPAAARAPVLVGGDRRQLVGTGRAGDREDR